VLLCAPAFVLAGCGGGSTQSTNPAALKLQREDFVLVSRTLAAVRSPVAHEVTATKAAWPLVANGLPTNIALVSRAPQARLATARATHLPLPAPFGEAQARKLTGPAAQLAGVFRSYALLSTRGWQMLGASVAQIETASPANARFARANAPLYIESIYDGHFALAQIGKKLLAGYEKLGGPAAFGAALPRAAVTTLAENYSEATDRLHPHPGVRLGS